MPLKRNPSELTSILSADKIELLESINNKTAWRAYRDTYAKAQNLEIITPYPIQIDFELNATCNLACPMCPLSTESNADKSHIRFPFELFCKIIDDGVARGLKAIKLNYLNEPLLRKDLEQFIAYAKRAGVLDVYLSTNGLLLSKSRIESLLDSGLDRIQISIDAHSKEVYDIIRPGGDYDLVVQNVLALLEARKRRESLTPLVRVNFVRTERNEHELDSFVGFWKDRADMIGVQEMVLPTKSLESIHSKTTEKKSSFGCSFPYKQLVITAEGEVLPCCTFWGEKMPLGNIITQFEQQGSVDLCGFWLGEQMKELREIHKSGRFNASAICAKCVQGALSQ